MYLCTFNGGRRRQYCLYGFVQSTVESDEIMLWKKRDKGMFG